MDNEILLELCAMKHTFLTRNVNYLKIPTANIPMTQVGVEQFNRIYFWVRNLPDMHEIVFTPSGGISTDKTNFRLPAYGIKHTKWMVELVVMICEGVWRIQFTNAFQRDKADFGGHEAFLRFKDLCKKYEIDLNDYKITNGPEVKATIPKYLIKMERESYAGKIFENCHHIDYHSSFPTGLVLTHPEFRPVIEELYRGRKLKPHYKQILNFTIGFMQSIGGCNARWANLSKDAITNNNERIEELARRLRASGRVVLLYNTDGIWYSGEVYHDENEGPNLGNWSNDHVNCKLWIKSKGAYQFIENGQCYTKLRGHTKLDQVKPRDDDGLGWNWGDMFDTSAKVIKFSFNKKGGLELVYGEEWETEC